MRKRSIVHGNFLYKIQDATRKHKESRPSLKRRDRLAHYLVSIAAQPLTESSRGVYVSAKSAWPIPSIFPKERTQGAIRRNRCGQERPSTCHQRFRHRETQKPPQDSKNWVAATSARRSSRRSTPPIRASFDHLREFAHKNGLTVDEGASSLARRTMVMRGPVNKIEQAFGVTLNDYEHEGRKYHSYVGTISMTQEHAEPVEAVLGLDNHPIAKPHFRIRDKGERRSRHQLRHRPQFPLRPTRADQLLQSAAGRPALWLSHRRHRRRGRPSASSNSAAATTPAT